MASRSERRTFKDLSVDSFIATVGGIGLLPIAPGTWASFAVFLTTLLISQFAEWAWLGYLALFFFSLVAGALSIRHMAGTWGSDPSEVVIDEVCGMALVYAVPLCTSSLAWSIAGFLLFRMYDIAKPFPINKINERTDPFSVMIDDVLAGVFTVVSIYAFQFGINLLIPTIGSI